MATADEVPSTGLYPAGEYPDDVDNLEDLSSVKYSKPKLHLPHLCPVCGTSDTEELHYDWKCNNNNCDVLTYIPTP